MTPITEQAKPRLVPTRHILTGINRGGLLALLALALAFGFGSRDLARNIMAGYHARESFEEGQQLSVRGHSGQLVSIGTVKSVIKTGKGLVSLPNSVLTEEEVTVLKSRKAE